MFGLTIHSKRLSAGLSQVKVYVRCNIQTDLDRTATELVLAKYGTVVQDDENYSVIEV